jgi:hypothetical protein
LISSRDHLSINDNDILINPQIDLEGKFILINFPSISFIATGITRKLWKEDVNASVKEALNGGKIAHLTRKYGIQNIITPTCV